MSRLVDAMKGETSLEAKLYELTVLANTEDQESINEFIHKGGVAILCQQAKETLVGVPSKRADAAQWQVIQASFKQMVIALDRMPITWSLLNKTKLGKAINSVLKARIFDESTNELTADLVNKWKKMVKDYKKQQETEF